MCGVLLATHATLSSSSKASRNPLNLPQPNTGVDNLCIHHHLLTKAPTLPPLLPPPPPPSSAQDKLQVQAAREELVWLSIQPWYPQLVQQLHASLLQPAADIIGGGGGEGGGGGGESDDDDSSEERALYLQATRQLILAVAASLSVGVSVSPGQQQQRQLAGGRGGEGGELEAEAGGGPQHQQLPLNVVTPGCSASGLGYAGGRLLELATAAACQLSRAAQVGADAAAGAPGPGPYPVIAEPQGPEADSEATPWPASSSACHRGLQSVLDAHAQLCRALATSCSAACTPAPDAAAAPSSSHTSVATPVAATAASCSATCTPTPGAATAATAVGLLGRLLELSRSAPLQWTPGVGVGGCKPCKPATLRTAYLLAEHYPWGPPPPLTDSSALTLALAGLCETAVDLAGQTDKQLFADLGGAPRAVAEQGMLQAARSQQEAVAQLLHLCRVLLPHLPEIAHGGRPRTAGQAQAQAQAPLLVIEELPDEGDEADARQLQVQHRLHALGLRLLELLALHSPDPRLPTPWANTHVHAACASLQATLLSRVQLSAPASRTLGRHLGSLSTLPDSEVALQDLLAAWMPLLLQRLRDRLVHGRSELLGVQAPEPGGTGRLGTFERALLGRQLCWLVRRLRHPHMGDMLHVLLPAVLSTVDDPSPAVSCSAVWALHHLATQALPAGAGEIEEAGRNACMHVRGWWVGMHACM